MSRPGALLRVLSVVLALGLCSACTETKEDLIVKGNLDLWKHQPDEALKKFQKVLGLDPANADAHRGMANAYGMKADVANREQYLIKAFALPDLRQKDKQYFAEELEKFYLDKAASSTSDEAAYEKALQQAMSYDKKSKAAALLAKFYLEKANKLAEEQKFQDAVAMFDRVTALPVESSRFAAQAESGRDMARMSLLTTSYAASFATRKEQLAKEGKFDPQRNRWVATLPVPMPPVLAVTDPSFEEKATAIASHEAYKKILDVLAAEAGTTVPEPLPQVQFASWLVDKAAWAKKPKEFMISASIDYDDGLRAMYFLQKIAESRKASAAANAAVQGGGEPAAAPAAAPAPAAPAAPAPAPAPASAPPAP